MVIIPNTTKALETILKHDKEADEQIEGFTGGQLTET